MTEQKPIDSPFTASSTASDVIKGIDLTGKLAIVTGGYSGIGLETTKVLVSAGAKVIVPAKDLEKATKNLAGINNVEIEQLNLQDPTSIDTFAQKFLNSDRPLHLLINDAGIMECPLTRDARGYEAQFSTNHLGHFQLTLRLWPALKKANGARVVCVSSQRHRFSPVIFEDIHYNSREYIALNSYGQSKTANILFAKKLDQIGKDLNIRAFSLHPGVIVETNLSRYLPSDIYQKRGMMDENRNVIFNPLKQVKTIPQGASTNVWCATSPLLNGKGGVYCENNNISYVNDDSTRGFDEKGFVGVMSYAINQESADKLWSVSEQLTGVKL